jgi:tetratricopeptide (TPR) repeat protein
MNARMFHKAKTFVARTIMVLGVVCVANADNIDDSMAPALAAYEARDFSSAINQLTDLSAANSDPAIRFHLARIQHQAGYYNDAKDTLDALIEDYPEFVEGYYLSGFVNLSLIDEVNIFRKLGTAKRALDDWQRAVELDPGNLDTRYAVFAFFVNAPGIAGGDLEKARIIQTELAEMNPGYGTLASALLLAKAEDNDAAETNYIEAIRLLNSAASHFALVQFYMQTEQYEKALAQLEKYQAVEPKWSDPDVTVTHLVMARANAGIGNIDLARQHATTALSKNPNKRIKGLLEETLDEL